MRKRRGRTGIAGEEGVRRVRHDDLRLARLVLRAVNRTQTKGSTARLAVPRDPEVVDELGFAVTEEEILSAEEYLEDQGYLALADIGLTRGTYTITTVGLKWLEGDPPGPSETSLREEGKPKDEGSRLTVKATQDGAQRPWWRRVLGR